MPLGNLDMRQTICLAILAANLLVAAVAQVVAEPLTVISWNLQGCGGEGTPLPKELPPSMSPDLWCFSRAGKVRSESLQGVIGRRFTSCSIDRATMHVFYDAKRLRCLNATRFEKGDVPASLVLFLDRATDVEFIVLVAEFDEGDRGRQQARTVRRWCEEQTKPVVGAGDFRFEVKLGTLRGNPAFDEFMLDYRWRWVRPHPLVDTHWEDSNKDGRDDHPMTYADFVYLGGNALNWLARTKVLEAVAQGVDQPNLRRPIQLTVNPR